MENKPKGPRTLPCWDDHQAFGRCANFSPQKIRAVLEVNTPYPYILDIDGLGRFRFSLNPSEKPTWTQSAPPKCHPWRSRANLAMDWLKILFQFLRQMTASPAPTGTYSASGRGCSASMSSSFWPLCSLSLLPSATSTESLAEPSMLKESARPSSTLNPLQRRCHSPASGRWPACLWRSNISCWDAAETRWSSASVPLREARQISRLEGWRSSCQAPWDEGKIEAGLTALFTLHITTWFAGNSTNYGWCSQL